MDSRRDMPEQTLFEILLWLPVVSLLRFRSVCKSWFSFINSSTFTTQHLHLHRGNDSLIVTYYPQFVGRRHFYLLSGNRYEVHTNLDFKEQWYTTIGRDVDHGMDLVTSCNGIICLHDVNSGNLLLWNPALKQLRHLPKSSAHHLHKEDTQFTIIGFGHDAKTDDYKVVRIIWYWHEPTNQVEVYSLKTSSWKIIHKNDALPFNFISRNNLCHATSKDGTCFWVGVLELEYANALVSFDLKDEVFETMLLPNKGPIDWSYALNFLDDKLVYIVGVYSGPYVHYHGHFEIWMLGEFGVNESWNKIHNIRSLCDPKYMADMIGFSKDGELIFIDHGRLKLYNLVTYEIYPPTIEERNYEVCKFLQYNESLVSIKQADGGDY